ncbi:MAG: ABC-type enterochelin transport system substrate-binding protein [Candidatus Midichloriaceae bacterium]|jgi:ABC-type enterochelin transport system substrate-binding protein
MALRLIFVVVLLFIHFQYNSDLSGQYTNYGAIEEPDYERLIAEKNK